jgi:type II secretory pathway pseudopilin PulG
MGVSGGDQRGIALLEVIIAAVIVGITVLGVSLMLVRGSAFTTAQSTNQAELYLAEQKLERLRILGFTGTPVLGPTDPGATDGCADNKEPCYNETVQGGIVASGQLQRFTRLTCVDYVSDNGPPYPSACPSGPPSQLPCETDNSQPSCTKRVRVTVQPLNQAPLVRADPVTFEVILVNPPPAKP